MIFKIKSVTSYLNGSLWSVEFACLDEDCHESFTCAALFRVSDNKLDDDYSWFIGLEQTTKMPNSLRSLHFNVMNGCHGNHHSSLMCD